MAAGAVDGLSGAVRGRVVEQGSPDYDEARILYNAMIDKRPLAVVYCVDERDVAAAIGFAVSAAHYAVLIQPGETIYAGDGCRLRVVDVIAIEDEASEYVGMLRVEAA